MIIFRNFPIKIQDNTVVTIGNFDGFHLGHQKLINENISFASQNNLKSCVVLFEKQPKEFFLKDRAPKRIFNLRTKVYKLLEMKVDYVCIINFNLKFSQLIPEDFINKLLKNLSMKALFVGCDFSFGFQKKGNIQFIQDNYPFLFLKVLPDLHINGIKISSSLLREHLIYKKFKKVFQITNNDYCIFGKVVCGNKLARTLNAPTANILIKNQNLVLNGVYFSFVIYQNQKFPAISHIGARPTVENTEKQFLEVHILNFNQNLYGKELKVCFTDFSRDIFKFDNILQLKDAIATDINNALSYWKINQI